MASQMDADQAATEQAARQVAMEWHGGQGSALYAFGSAGSEGQPLWLLDSAEVEAANELRMDGRVTVEERQQLSDLISYLQGISFARRRDEAARIERIASRLGRQAGRDRGSWALNGTTTADYGLAVLRALDGWGRYSDEVVDSVMPSGWLSGEWADDPTPHTLADDLGLDEDRDGDRLQDACDVYEQAALAGASEVIRKAAIAAANPVEVGRTVGSVAGYYDLDDSPRCLDHVGNELPDGEWAPIFSDSEADSPTHCAEPGCEVLISHRLTSHGRRYVAEALEDDAPGRPEITARWLLTYGEEAREAQAR